VDAQCSNFINAALGQNLMNLGLSKPQGILALQAHETLQGMMPEGIEVSFVQKTEMYLDLEFHWRHIKLCQTFARVHKNLNMIRGRIPEESWGTPVLEPNAWAYELKSDTLAEILPGFREKSQEACLYHDGEAYYPAWVWRIHDAAGLPYEALMLEGELLSLAPSFFEADGSATIYAINEKDQVALKTVALAGLSQGGSLCEARLSMSAPVNWPTAFETTHAYHYPTNDLRFLETSVFVNAQRHADWFISLPAMERWPGPHIILNYVDYNDTQVNNPHYVPYSSGVLPKIIIGPGDGVALKNLMIDEAVIYHELSHHVIYQHITRTQGSSLVLHEGLSDFFAQMQTKKPCLGALICPKGSMICPNDSCLRTADNNMTFLDAAVLSMKPHQQSQVISGFLWDLYLQIKDPLKTANLVLKGLSYVPKDSGYVDFITGLKQADQELNKGSWSAIITQLAKERGINAAAER
jgi:hypothetical protein